MNKKTLDMEFAFCPPGKFMMGDEFDGPAHEVTITTGFHMQTTPVTQGQWQAVMGNNPSYFNEFGENCPVESVSWDDVQSFIRKLNSKEGTGCYALPTEAQWEYACRAGSSTTRYCFGDDMSQLPKFAWFGNNSGGTTHPVGELATNAWGLYDMHGNVWEWCQNFYDDYPSSHVSDPAGASSGTYRVYRGGGWHDDAWYCRSAFRYGSDPASGYFDLGFRLVLEGV